MFRIPIHCAFLYLTSVTCLIGAFHPRSAGAERPAAPRVVARTPARGPEAVRDVQLPALWATPSDWLGQTVRFTVQFHSVDDSWNPFVTRFGTDDYALVRFWSDSQVLWLPEEFERPLGVAFVRRTRPWLAGLRDSRPYQRYEVVARVAQVFLDRPWMELVSVRPLSGSMTEGALVHAGRGIVLYRNQHWRLAKSEFERARAVALDPRMHAQLDRLIGACRQLASDDELDPRG